MFVQQLGVYLMLFATAATAAESPDSETTATLPIDQVVEALVEAGLERNLGLAVQRIDLQRAEQALNEARAALRPQIDLSARYSVSRGGRDIVVPVAELLNPVYASLNQLLIAQGQSGQFPQIGETGFSLLREHEQDTRVTLRQLLYAPAVKANVDRFVAEREAFAADLERVRQLLARDIRVAYYSWSQARSTLSIVDSSLNVLTENVRVSQALFDNGKVTRDQVLRAEAERLELEQERSRAQARVGLARRYLNFLLDWPLDQQIAASQQLQPLPVLSLPTLASLELQTLAGRQELARLDAALRAAEAAERAAKSSRGPTLSAQLDVGIQGETYGFGRGKNQSVASLVLSVPISDGGARRSRQAQARLQRESLEISRQQLERQLRLELRAALEQLDTALKGYSSAEARVAAASEAFRIASRKRDVGTINQVEFIDSERAQTRAELNLNLTRFEVLIRRAELAYAAAADRPL